MDSGKDSVVDVLLGEEDDTEVDAAVTIEDDEDESTDDSSRDLEAPRVDEGTADAYRAPSFVGPRRVGQLRGKLQKVASMTFHPSEDLDVDDVAGFEVDPTGAVDIDELLQKEKRRNLSAVRTLVKPEAVETPPVKELGSMYESREEMLSHHEPEKYEARLLKKSKRAEDRLMEMSLPRRTCIRFLSFIRRHPMYYEIPYLSIMGLVVACVAVGTTFGADSLLVTRAYVTERLEDVTAWWILPYLWWIGWTFVFGQLGVVTSLLIFRKATGSGIPEMKSILSGVSLPAYLGWRAGFSKMIGLTLSVGSGLLVGKEGPFVHMASIVANLMSRLSIFRNIRDNADLRTQMLGVACSCGVAGTFGTPIGGVLFSVEVASTYYPVRNYWYSFFASVVSAFVFRLLSNSYRGEPIFNALLATDYDSREIVGIVSDPGDLFLVVILGVLGGITGGLFTLFQKKMCIFRKWMSQRSLFFNTPWLYTAIVLIATGIITFPFPNAKFMSLGSLSSLRALFSRDELDPRIWPTNISPLLPLIAFTLSRFLLTGASVSVPIPCGLFVPVMVLGAGLGRVMGTTIDEFLASEHSDQIPGVYAIVGAASMAAGVTHTLSSAMIMFELTGQLVLLVPVCLGVVLAAGVSRILTVSVYDSIIQTNDELPYLPDLVTRNFGLLAKDIMNTNVVFVTRRVQYKALVKILRDVPLEIFPVIKDKRSFILLGQVRRETLEALIQEYHREKMVFLSNFEMLNAPAHEPMSPSRPQDSLDAVESAHLMGHVLSVESRREQQLIDRNLIADDEADAMFDGTIYIPFEDCPVQLLTSTPMAQVHLMFVTLRASEFYVTHQGVLLGSVSREGLRRAIEAVKGWF